MERTLAILKPDCVKQRLIGQVLQIIQDDGFTILALKMLKLSRAVAESFYDIHKDKEFFPYLIDFMTEGACVVTVLEKENAIQAYRTLMGSTDPVNANEGTIRKKFAENVSRNVVHGSDSLENGLREISFFFSESELV